MDEMMANYVMRAECPADADKLRDALGAACVSVEQWKVEPPKSPFPDVEVSFSSAEPAELIRAVIETVPDGHAMAETFAAADVYDGVRTYRSSVKAEA